MSKRVSKWSGSLYVSHIVNIFINHGCKCFSLSIWPSFAVLHSNSSICSLQWTFYRGHVFFRVAPRGSPLICLRWLALQPGCRTCWPLCLRTLRMCWWVFLRPGLVWLKSNVISWMTEKYLQLFVLLVIFLLFHFVSMGCVSWGHLWSNQV